MSQNSNQYRNRNERSNRSRNKSRNRGQYTQPNRNQSSNDPFAKYISNQARLVKLDYDLETKEKQKTAIDNVDLVFMLRSTYWSKKTRNWTTTLPLPKNLIPPEYLIINDPTYVNVSDKIIIIFNDNSKKQIEGSVIKIYNGELTALFQLDWEENSARHICSIHFLPNDTMYKRKINALKNLEHLNIDLKNMLIGIYPKNLIKRRINLQLPNGYPFNESQKKAIQMAVTNPFTLIRGPPGTGKTHTIGAIAIQSLHQEPDKKVLICGTTNVSINSLLEIVGDMVQLAGFKVCWPAASQRDFDSEENLTKEQKLMTLYQSLHHKSDLGIRFKELYYKKKRIPKEEKEMKDLREKLECQIIDESDVIVSTLDSSAKRSISISIMPYSKITSSNSNSRLGTLIVDEATLSVESSMIIPLSLCPERFILVGDHKQLGPQPSFDELRKKGYYHSMFERIIHKKLCLKNSVMLSTQYRMHPDISRIPNRLFYDDELIDGVQPDMRKIAENFVFKKHLNFINNNTKEEKNGTSYINREEIKIVFKLVTSLTKCGVIPSQIGVISAYGAQTQSISDHLRINNIRVKVSTIDSFQGSQRDYIIICTTRSGSDLGFLSDKRRMNVAITRARCLAVIIGNEDTLSQSSAWYEIIHYTKIKKSYYEKLPMEIARTNQKQLIITRSNNDGVREMVSEFKEKGNNVGYKLDEIESEISDSSVRVLWPDEIDDVSFLKDWVQSRISALNKNKNVTLAYDAESVCIQIGDVFDKNVDYYNWEPYKEIPEIKTSESIIISCYRHKGKFENDAKLIKIIKPLFEHPKITLITFDFTFDFDKLYDYDISIKTNKIIDVQLAKIPDEINNNEGKDLICSKGWSGIKNFVLQANEDNVNSCIIQRAKKSVKSGKKDFPHEENKFLIDHFNYPPICRVTKTFLEYSANDIFYTAIVGVDLLCRGELDNVKKLTTEKFKLFRFYRNKYGNAREIRNFNYAGESFTSAIQGQFTNETQTYQLLSYYKLLKTFVSSIDKYDDLINSIIPGFGEDDKNRIRSRYSEIVEIMKNPKYVHLGNIKDNALLAYVDGVDSKPAFVLRPKEDIDDEQDDKMSNRKDIPSRTKNSMNISSSIEKESTIKSKRTETKRSINTTKLDINSTLQSPKNLQIKTIDEQESYFNKPEGHASRKRKARSESVSRHNNHKVDNENKQVNKIKIIDNQDSSERSGVSNHRFESLSRYKNSEVDDDDIRIHIPPKNQQVKMIKTINNQDSSERSGGINKRSPSVSKHLNYKRNVDDNTIRYPRQNPPTKPNYYPRQNPPTQPNYYPRQNPPTQPSRYQQQNRQKTNTKSSMDNHESSQINKRTSINQPSSIPRQKNPRSIKSRYLISDSDDDL